MTKKKTKIAPAATEKPKSEPAEAELITPEPAQPKPEPPISLEDRLAALEQGQKDADDNFRFLQDYLGKLDPLINAIEQSQRQAQAAQAAGGANPQAPMGLNIPPWLSQIIGGALGGGGSSDSEFMELAKESMRADIAFTKSLKGAIIGKITGSATTEVAKAAVGQ